MANKVLDEIIVKEITAFFERSSLFTHEQFGIRKRYNIEIATLDLVEYIGLAIYLKRVLMAMLLNFSAAFIPAISCVIFWEIGSLRILQEVLMGVCLRSFVLTAYVRGFGQRSRVGGIYNKISNCEFTRCAVPGGACHIQEVVLDVIYLFLFIDK